MQPWFRNPARGTLSRGPYHDVSMLRTRHAMQPPIRLEELAQILAVAVGGFAVMDNHVHLLVRLDPDLAWGWLDDGITSAEPYTRVLFSLTDEELRAKSDSAPGPSARAPASGPSESRPSPSG